MIVARGSSGARAASNFRSIVGWPICLKPGGTVVKILIGYLPDLLILVRQKSHAAMVNTSSTKALRIMLMKKNVRAKAKVLDDDLLFTDL